ncbi:MAG: hypothetical protein JO314_09410 [Acidobacteria bacterium]|nr:hypothetical protein [Acidobacteriota bacterium]
MPADLEQIYDRLYKRCAGRGFAGFDPFDGLNSRIFQTTPLRNSRLARLALTQLVKRSPVNLRPLLKVEPGINPKAIALFALAELSRLRTTGNQAHASNAISLLDQLLELAVEGGNTLAFGYNFDWQSRIFFAPRGTPTIVPTAFASQAFAEGARELGDHRYLDAVQQIANFAATGLNRSVETDDEICFSYTPLDESLIFNASLLAAECLMRSVDPGHHEIARKAVNFVIRRQRDDGAWPYGGDDSQGWVDNFHTAYVLQSIRRIADSLGTSDEIEAAFDQGKEYWLMSFFLDDGTSKYYSDKTYPIDIHSAGVAIAALAELGEIERASRIADWTIDHLRDVDGFFYYRLGSLTVDQSAFMRWGQAWMAYALARLLEVSR